MPRAYIKKNIAKKYSDNKLKLAIEAVANGCSIRAAAKDFSIPYTTLNSHSNSLVLYNDAGRPPKFSTEEETCLEQAALTLQVRSYFSFLSIFLIFFLYKELGYAINKS